MRIILPLLDRANSLEELTLLENFLNETIKDFPVEDSIFIKDSLFQKYLYLYSKSLLENEKATLLFLAYYTLVIAFPEKTLCDKKFKIEYLNTLLPFFKDFFGSMEEPNVKTIELFFTIVNSVPNQNKLMNFLNEIKVAFGEQILQKNGEKTFVFYHPLKTLENLKKSLQPPKGHAKKQSPTK